MARWRSGRSSDRRWAASTAGTTAAASSSNAATVKPVRWPNTAGRFRRLSRCAIMGRHHRGKSRPDILRTTRYRECGLMVEHELAAVEQHPVDVGQRLLPVAGGAALVDVLDEP